VIQLIKKIYRKINGTPSANKVLIKKGFLQVGISCELSAMNIVLVDELAGHTNISIGNNCCIRGTIMIYKATSKVIIGDNVYIGPGTLIECVDEVTIGNDVMISLNCNIIDTNSHSLHSADRKNDTIDWQKGLAYKNWDVVETKKITIGNSCWIGLRSIIMKGVFLSEGTIVASGSVVTKSTEPYTIIGGNPAKFIKQTD
jgi:acetyltransferase-like isoleucine patch superfamily enzyme